MTIADAAAEGAPGRARAVPDWLWLTGRLLLQLAVIYLGLLAIHAYLGWWSPDYLQGRSLWHFWFTRMIVPMVMLGVLASFARLLAREGFGVALAAQNKLGEAEALFREVATARRRVLGDEHAETLVCFGNLASLCLFPQGRCAEAETIQRHVLSVQRRTIGEDHPHTLTTAHNLADSIRTQGRHEEARELAGVVLEARVRTQGWSHPETEKAARSSVRMQFSAARTSRKRSVSSSGPVPCGTWRGVRKPPHNT